MAAYESPGAYWEAQASHLLRQIEVYASYTAARGPFQPMNILVAGEAAEAADFRDVVQAVAGQIPGLLHRQDRFWHLQVVFSGDPAFAAARGAAVWRGMELDETYCDEFYESGELSDPYAEEEKHVEL
ncbi:hypothetical protein SBRCBS47491_002827 [Sporothrix bragantina]|uniref:Uncharacterized protein n=1 Tax=Sporothrix bragantina TaxID=671064 RepID=A0ABP0BA17_9PEZI